MEQVNSSQPHEKVMTQLHRTYNQALVLLKRGLLADGIKPLLNILHHPYIHDSDMENLKYSVFMSLAEVHKAQGELTTALGFLWQALQILQGRWKSAQRGESTLKQEPEQQFTLILKMIQIVEKLHLPDELIYLLKKSIKLSPVLWREKLILKLRGVYESQGKQEALKDLLALMEDRDKMQKVLSENIQRRIDPIDSELVFSEVAKKAIPKLHFKIDLAQKQELLLKYTNWQLLLTISYVLLKSQCQRNFGRKKYLHRKYDESNKEWNEFLRGFSRMQTKIAISFVRHQQGNQMVNESAQKQAAWAKSVTDLALQILKGRHLKKKHQKKVLNPLEELSRIPSINLKDPKKNVAAQTKSVYSSLNHYFRDLLSKNHFKKELLDDLKQLEPEQHSLIIGEIIRDEPETMKAERDENEQQDNEGSILAGQGISESEKESREKKTIKVKKAQLMQYQRQLNAFIAQFFGRATSYEPVLFNNVCEMIEEITGKVVQEPVENRGKVALITNTPIRRILQKNILKVIQAADGFFEELESIQFLELLMEKLQQLADKDPKSTPFKAYQDHKKSLLIDAIKKHFEPTPFQLQRLLSSDLSEPELRRMSHICLHFAKLHSLYGQQSPEEVAFYRDLFVIFKVREQVKSQKNGANLEAKVMSYIDREIEKWRQKVANRTSLLSMNQEAQEQVSSVEELYKQDKEISAMLPLLKVFKCHPEQLKLKPTQGPEEISSTIYLENFVKLIELFFKKVDLESRKQFNCRLLTLLGQIMKLKQIITFLYEKMTDGVTFKAPPSEANRLAYTQTLFYLIRLHFLNIVEENDYCLKMVFFLVNSLLKGQSEERKYILVPKCICLFDELIKFRKSKPEQTYSLRKRLYHSFILKNLHSIYDNPLFLDKEEPNKGSKPKKPNRSRSSSEEGGNNPLSLKQPVQSEDIKEKVFQILHGIYFCPDKEREFNPKRIQDAVGYFMYMLRGYNEMFRQRVIELEYDALKMFKKCFKIYIEKRDEVYNFCQQFKAFIHQFKQFLSGEDQKVNKEQLTSIIRQQQPICECCPRLTRTHSFYVETLFVLGKFYEAQFAQPELAPSKEAWLEEIDKDQDFYMEYLALNLQKEAAWENLIRVNASKSFFYFDSLLSEPFDRFKDKFHLTKKINQLISQVCPHFRTLQRYGSATVEILNILKIKERQYLMVQKEIETMGIPTKESRELEKKYMDGMKRVQGSTVGQLSRDVRVRYLRLSEIKCKLVWNSLERERTEQRKQDSSVIIELDEESNDSKVSHPPSKNIEQLSECIQQAKGILLDIYSSPDSKQLMHLQEDVVCEIYVLLSRHFEWKLNKVLANLCGSIAAGLERNKYLREAEFNISDLSHTLQLLAHVESITNNPKYQLNQDKLQVEAEDYAALQSTLSTIFVEAESKREEVEELEGPLLEGMKEEVEEGHPQLNRSRMSEESVGKESKRSNSHSSEKPNKPRKSLCLDIGNYIRDYIAKHIISNKLSKNPLNHLQAFLTRPTFQAVVLQMVKALTEIARVMMELPRYQIKRYRNRRSVVMSLLYCAHLAIVYSNSPQRANDLIRDYYNFKHEQFTTVNLYNEKLTAERNELLADFYNRIIVHQIMRIQFIRQIFDVFVAQGHKDSLIQLIKKLIKLTHSNQSKPEKEKLGKGQYKQLTMDPEGPQGKKEKEEKDKEPKEKGKGKHRKEHKDHFAKDLQSVTYVGLLCEGALKLVQLLRRESEQREMEDKYEKSVLQFRNKIKKLVVDDKNPYLARIEEFINIYQNQFDKKIKLKKTKKDKEPNEPSKREQPLIFTQLITPLPQLNLPVVLPYAPGRSPKSQSSHGRSSQHSKTPKKKRAIEKREKVPRPRKPKLPKTRTQPLSQELGNEKQPIQIKQSPLKEEQMRMAVLEGIEVDKDLLMPEQNPAQILERGEQVLAEQGDVDKAKQSKKTAVKERGKSGKDGKGSDKMDQEEDKEKPTRLSRRISEKKAQSLQKRKVSK